MAEYFSWMSACATVVGVVFLVTSCEIRRQEQVTIQMRDQRSLRSECITKGGSVIEASGYDFHCVMMEGK